MIVVVIAFHLKDELMVEHETPDAKIIGLFITAFLLGIIDLMGELLGWRKIDD
jgi:predicted translin family RNA/ssDNA-binding protein